MNTSIQQACSTYASGRGAAPFTTAQCFNEMKNAEDISEVSDALGRLYRNGSLARRKIDNVRYEYVWANFAGPDFEKSEDALKKIQARKGKPAIAATGFREDPAPAPEIPQFLRKTAPSPQPSPTRGEGAEATLATNQAPLDKGGLGGFTPKPEAIADAMLERLGLMLKAQRELIEARIDNVLGNAHQESPDTRHVQSCRVTVRIKEVEITVEGQ